VADEPLIIVDWTVPAELVVAYDTVIVCRAGIIASQRMFQYLELDPNEQETDDCAVVDTMYSAALESPVPATAVTRVAVVPPIVPAVSVVVW